MELLATGGEIPVRTAETGERKKRSPRYEGIRQGVILFFIGAVAVPLLGILNSYQRNGSAFLDILVAASAVIFFVGGFVRLLYALIFEEGAPTQAQRPMSLPYSQPVAPPPLGVGQRPTALPPAQSIPVSSWRGRPNTAELVPPASVTENTTRLLDDPPEKSQR